MASKRPGFKRRHYLLRDEQIAEVRNYMRRNHIRHEVVAIRLLLAEGLNFLEIRRRVATLGGEQTSAEPEPAPLRQATPAEPISETV